MKAEERQQWAAVEAEFYASEPEVMARLRSEYAANPQGFVLLYLGIGENQTPYPTFGQGMPQSMQESKWAFRVAQQGVRELFAERERMIAELAALRNVQHSPVAAAEHSAFVVIQEGGASAERYIHSSDSAEAAEEFRASCETASYRTSAPIEVPGALAAHGEALYELLETVVTAELDYPADGQEWKP